MQRVIDFFTLFVYLATNRFLVVVFPLCMTPAGVVTEAVGKLPT
jgi:ABC-type uncharacterized transport system permease subunit